MSTSFNIRNCFAPRSSCVLHPLRGSAFDISQIHRLAPQGMAGFVLANGPAVVGSSKRHDDCDARSARRERATNLHGWGGQGDIRRALIEADLMDCMVALECDPAKTSILNN